MTKRYTHDDFEQLNIYNGIWTTQEIGRWPRQAQDHVEHCATCKQRLQQDQQIVLAVNSGPLTALASLAAPMAELLRRSRRTPTEVHPLATHTAELPRFPAATYRSAALQRGADGGRVVKGGALDLTRTESGVRAWDPDAHWMALFLVQAKPNGRVRLMGTRSASRPGVSMEINIRPQEPELVVAFAARGAAVEPTTLELWLEDASAMALNRDEIVRLAGHDKVHVQALELRPVPTRTRITLRPDALPEKKPAVAAALKRASSAGRNGSMADATKAYRTALRMARNEGDEAGMIAGSEGLAMCLDELGYSQDAAALLCDVVERRQLDRKSAVRMCRALARKALAAADLTDAETWLAEAERLEPSKWWTSALLAELDARRGRFAAACDRLEAAEWPTLPAAALTGWRLVQAHWLAKAGRVEDARQVLNETSADYLDTSLTVLRAQAVAALVMQTRRPDWEKLALPVLNRLRASQGPDNAITRRWVLELADDARQDGAFDTCRHLVAAALVGGEAWPASGGSFLGVCATRRGLLIVRSGCTPRSMHMTADEVRRWVSKAREEVEQGLIAEGTKALGLLLYPEGNPPHGQLLVASDGALVGAPLEAAFHAIAPKSKRPEIAICVQSNFQPAPLGRRTLSIANAHGDLVFAESDTSISDASRTHHGRSATTTVLREETGHLSEVGLLHLGLHAHREQGVPVIEFFDRTMSALEVETLSLPGWPVVVLAGCATGDRNYGGGSERSLARAFLRAGASAVIATRWPMEDRDASSLVCAIVNQWPFTSAARAVALASETLRECGTSPKVWAAAVVYH